MNAKPIYLVEMSGSAWQLLWWLLSRMDKNQEVHGGWRTAGARAIGRDRSWLTHNVTVLNANGLITTGPRARYVKVLVNAIRG